MEEIMIWFVMVVIEKWSKVVVFALEPPIYYLWGYQHIFHITVPVILEGGGISELFCHMGCELVPPCVTISWNNLIKLYFGNFYENYMFLLFDGVKSYKPF